MAFQILSNEQAKSYMDEADKNAKPKKKELEMYLNRIAHNPDRFNNLTHTLIRDMGKTAEGKSCGLIEINTDEMRLLTMSIISKFLFTEMKVNGKEGHWNNGCFGSRWYDWTSEDGNTTCRVAFFTKKFGQVPESIPKDYVLEFKFERSA